MATASVLKKQLIRTEVAQDRFREDLYYRLAVVELHSPSLRERPSDIPILIDHFLRVLCNEYGMRLKSCDPNAMHLMEKYSWPGNIRELRNVIERLLILSDDVIHVKNLPVEIQNQQIEENHLVAQMSSLVSWQEFKRVSEKAYLTRVLSTAHGNMAEAARILGVERSTVLKWIRALEIQN